MDSNDKSFDSAPVTGSDAPVTGSDDIRQPLTDFDIPPLVVTDLDGTLLDYRTRRVPDGFGKMLDRILAAGSAFAVASGRPPASIRSIFPEHADRIWILSDNGARLSFGGTIVAGHEIPETLWAELAAAACQLPETDVVLVGDAACYARERRPEDAAFFRVAYFPLVVAPDPVSAARGDCIRKVIVCRRDGPDDGGPEALRERFGDRLCAVSAEPGWIDFMPAGVDKGVAVRELQDRLGIAPERCVCFGDWENDAPMLAACGRSYAMTGGHPAAIAAARFLAPPCTEGGEVTVLERLFN